MSIPSQIDFYLSASRFCNLEISIRDQHGWSKSHKFSTHSSTILTYDFDDSQQQEVFLQLELKGKTKSFDCHDVSVNLDRIVLDHVDMTNYFRNLGLEYCHDHNGNSDLQTHKFGGNMGCDGTVKLNFACPVYQWIRSIYQRSRFK